MLAGELVDPIVGEGLHPTIERTNGGRVSDRIVGIGRANDVGERPQGDIADFIVSGLFTHPVWKPIVDLSARVIKGVGRIRLIFMLIAISTPRIKKTLTLLGIVIDYSCYGSVLR